MLLGIFDNLLASDLMGCVFCVISGWFVLHNRFSSTNSVIVRKLRAVTESVELNGLCSMTNPEITRTQPIQS